MRAVIWKGSEMATTFNMMRANDLIWSFVINNYLLGKGPFPFDLLYWNSDSTRMPAAMHGFYLRKMYVENKLIEPGGIELDGVPIDLTTVNIPKFILSTREDHIAPWKSTYAAVNTYKGPVKFCLAAVGAHRRCGSIRPIAASIRTGPIQRSRRAPMLGSKAQPSTRDPGGRNGANGLPGTVAAKSPRGRPATAH